MIKDDLYHSRINRLLVENNSIQPCMKPITETTDATDGGTVQ